MVTVHSNPSRRPLPLLNNTVGSRKSKTNTEFLFSTIHNPNCQNNPNLYTAADTALQYRLLRVLTVLIVWSFDCSGFVLFCFTVQFCVLSATSDCTGSYWYNLCIVTAFLHNNGCQYFITVLQRCLLGETGWWVMWTAETCSSAGCRTGILGLLCLWVYVTA